jgi:protein dithiol oxidoreductase (disulfide-forming)
MLRRDFSLGLAATTTAGALPAAWAQAPANFQDGKDFLTLEKRASTEASAGKIEVVEFFWYSCSHCNAFEPKLQSWTKTLPKDVSFRRAPIAFQDTPNFVAQQRLYYTLEALGKVEQLHVKVFYAIHVDKLQLTSLEAISTWAQKQGLDKAKFETMFNSFGVATKARKASQLQNEYQVDGVPALGVSGRYYTSGALAQSMDRALQVVGALVDKSRKGA